MLWTALMLGLAGSLHCAGMCGPLALALPHTGATGVGFVSGRIAYNLGRIVTYCLLGVLFGLLGQGLFLAGVQRWVSIALGVALLVGLVTSRGLSRWMPVTRVVAGLKSRMAVVLRRRSVVAVGVLGLLNGLLPCGLVYVAGAGAMAAGSLGSGAAYMSLFGLGTVPMMLGIGLSGSLVTPSVRLRLARLVPISVVLLASLLILRGLALGIPYLSPDLAAGVGCHR